MKERGIVRRIDDLGRVVIPREMRRTMGISEGDPLEIFVVEGGITIKKYEPVDDVGSTLQQLKHLVYNNTLLDSECEAELLQKIQEMQDILAK